MPWRFRSKEKLNDEMAQREAKLAEEQKLLEDKMLQEPHGNVRCRDG